MTLHSIGQERAGHSNVTTDDEQEEGYSKRATVTLWLP